MEDKTTRYAYTDDFEAAVVESFFEMYDKYVKDNLTELKVERKKAIMDHLVKKLMQKKIRRFLFIMCCLLWCLKKNGKMPSGK